MGKIRSDNTDKPCVWTNCMNSGPMCHRCGMNPREIKRRKALLKKNGLTKVGDTRRLIITGRKKK